jgi:hypothetical protein
MSEISQDVKKKKVFVRWLFRQMPSDANAADKTGKVFSLGHSLGVCGPGSHCVQGLAQSELEPKKRRRKKLFSRVRSTPIDIFLVPGGGRGVMGNVITGRTTSGSTVKPECVNRGEM